MGNRPLLAMATDSPKSSSAASCEREPTAEKASEPGFLDRWLAAIILCGVAILQLVLAGYYGLSPWKGGGFGMFSTVDAPPMRLITVEGLDQNGYLVRIDPLDIMNEADQRRWHSWPDRVLLEKLADRIFALEYLHSGSQRRKALRRLESQNPDLILPEEEDYGDWVRPWRAGDPENAAFQMKAIRVEGWRLRYAPQGNKLVTDPLGDPVQRGMWP